LLTKTTIRRYTARGLTLLWGLITLNSMIFLHAHRLPNGRIVIHTHPYKLTGKQGPISNNPHTSFELFWLDMCTNAPFIPGVEPVLTNPVCWTIPATNTGFSYLLPTAEQRAIFACLRGPPAFPA